MEIDDSKEWRDGLLGLTLTVSSLPLFYKSERLLATSVYDFNALNAEDGSRQSARRLPARLKGVFKVFVIRAIATSGTTRCCTAR